MSVAFNYLMPGEFKHRATFQKRVQEQSASGEPIDSWVNVAKISALVEPLSGRELFAAQEIYPETDTRITVRYLSGLTPDMRILWTDPRTQELHQFDVTDLTDTEMLHRQIVIHATERPQGRNA